MNFTTANLVLSGLEPDVAARFEGRLQKAALRKGAVLQEPGEEVEWVWFPEQGLISLASESVGGESVSGAMIGCNGALGAFEACGSRRSFVRATVQIPGDAWRIRDSGYREMFDASSGLRTAVHKHVESLLVEARQFAACNAIHPVESRFSRVLLEMLERSRSGPVLPLTQENLANVLGVQRTTVAVVASNLHKSGVIRSGRGAVEVIDGARLERTACSCRETIAFAQAEIYASEEEVCEA